ncbi:MAG: hypothetical protein COA86_04135 [Kangiella sp.]|nr:MAG: hypothetical protein COA86_04135 [Kangiella sp.]
MKLLKIKHLIYTFLFVLNLHAEYANADTVEINGEFRSIYDYGNTRNGLVAGGHLAINYGFLENFKSRLAVYTAQPIIGSDAGIIGTGIAEGSDGFSILGEVNINYENDVHNITLGRQLVSSPLVTSHDAILIQGMFSGVNYSNKLFESTELRLMYFNEMSGRDNLHKKSEWLSMSKVLGTSYEKGMLAFGLTNSGDKNYYTSSTQFWYYNIEDTLNTFYASNTMIFSDSDYQLETHYWRSYSLKRFENDTGNKIDYHFIGSQISRNYGNLTLKFAYDHMGKKEGSYTIPKAFGNYAIYTYGLRLDSGAYGANIAGTGLKIRSMNAIKFTSLYKLEQRSIFIVGYMLGRSSDNSLQSDMNLLDIAWFSGKMIDNKLSLGVVLEILDSKGGGVFKSDTKLKLIAKYQL